MIELLTKFRCIFPIDFKIDGFPHPDIAREFKIKMLHRVTDRSSLRIQYILLWRDKNCDFHRVGIKVATPNMARGKVEACHPFSFILDCAAMKEPLLAIYAGTFDPITNGHLDVLGRACQLFERVVVAVAPNPGKSPLFALEERLRLVRENLGAFPNTEALPLEGLTVNFARQIGAKVIVRGLRAISDFEYEFQMAQMNRHLDDSIETIFLMPSQEFFYTSSNIVKSVACIDPDRVHKFVPPNVLQALKEKAKQRQA